MSNACVETFKDMTMNGQELEIKIYRMDYNDKAKTWGIVETTYGKSYFNLSSLSIPETIDYSDSSLIAKGIAPTPEPTQGTESPSSKSKRSSKVSRKSSASPSRQGKSKIIPNYFEGANCNISFSLNETLFYPPPTPPRPDITINDIIKHKPIVAKKDLPKPAFMDFREEIDKTVDIIVNEFLSVYKREIDENKISQSLLYKLNEQGVYYGFKEKIKGPLVALVQEKYSKEQMDDPKFIGSLYTYVMEQVTRVLNSRYLKASIDTVLNRQENSKKTEDDPQKELNTLLILSEEAELIDNYDLAKSYHLNRIQVCEEYGINDSKIYQEYGEFLLRINDIEQANECFRKGLEISIDDNELLYIYSIILLKKQVYDECEVILYEIRDRNPEDIRVWILLCTLYEVYLFIYN